MHAIVKIETTYSENPKLANKTFDNMLEADLAVVRACCTQDATDMSYWKTDFAITWEDGETYSGTLEANRANTFSSRVASVAKFYMTGDQPSWMTIKQWQDTKAKWQAFARNRMF